MYLLSAVNSIFSAPWRPVIYSIRIVSTLITGHHGALKMNPECLGY